MFELTSRMKSRLKMKKQQVHWMIKTHLKPLWNIEGPSVHHLQKETDTERETGPANNAGMVPTNTIFATRETTTVSGIPSLVQITCISSLIARVAKQDIIDNKVVTHTDWITACTEGLETGNLMKDKVDIHETPAGQAGKKALNICDLTRHPQNSALV